MSNYYFSSESVTEGHPDKMADQISDAILDAILKDDKKARVACETFLTTGLVLVGGEITTTTYVEMQSVVRKVIKDIGYIRAKYGFDYLTAGVMTAIGQQSPDISQGVTKAEEARKDGSTDIYDQVGAGDQGLMFGFACKDTPELMPLPIMKAHELCKKLADVRKNGTLKWLRPDGKSQVTVKYENDRPVSIDKVLISTQHHPETSNEEIRRAIIEHVIQPVLGNYYNDDIEIFVNPTGRFVIGGPQGDAGLTGRKIIVDTYGGMGRHGGGAFSGKDPTKVDRSACYMMRYVAKNIVAAGLADKCETQVAYAIGRAHPLSVYVNTFGTGKVDDEKIAKAVEKVFDLRPKAIIDHLDLIRPIYYKTAAYGHFGRNDPDFTWEKTDKVEALQSAI
jgi:S-adenosylmethionine synthetase